MDLDLGPGLTPYEASLLARDTDARQPKIELSDEQAEALGTDEGYARVMAELDLDDAPTGDIPVITEPIVQELTPRERAEEAFRIANMHVANTVGPARQWAVSEAERAGNALTKLINAEKAAERAAALVPRTGVFGKLIDLFRK